MIANRFKPMGLVAIGMMAAMGFYLISSRVASERTELQKVERQILAARKSIRQLQTEIGTRASMRQLERWNGEVLALTSPDASQYISEAALGHIDRSGITDGPRFLPAQMVTAMANTLTNPDAAPVPVAAASVTSAVRSDAVEVPVSPQTRALIVESRKPAKTLPKTVMARAETSEPAPRPPAAAPAKPRKTAVVAKLEHKLLDDRLLGELAQAARAEEKRR